MRYDDVLHFALSPAIHYNPLVTTTRQNSEPWKHVYCFKNKLEQAAVFAESKVFDGGRQIRCQRNTRGHTMKYHLFKRRTNAEQSGRMDVVVK
jgi:hypothetical protein